MNALFYLKCLSLICLPSWKMKWQAQKEWRFFG